MGGSSAATGQTCLAFQAQFMRIGAEDECPEIILGSLAVEVNISNVDSTYIHCLSRRMCPINQSVWRRIKA